ncbi:hypothetical protein [Phascolarctobacterium sp.]|uniref:hypothetical protein n=1 Tax=Phascolarctobacterium sp. TaxID=2049039 RepID=UPI0025F7C09F|nr:hypothetical protein [Phascolarctobacterium sp.]
MEEKINIAEILKDKPQGTKLYDWLYNIDVESDTISTTDTETVVWCINETDNNTTCHRGYSEFGTVRGCSDGLRILLPSKEMRDWSKFAWKKGDVLISNDGKKEVFFNGFTDDTYALFKAKHGFEVLSNGNTIYLAGEDGIATSDYTLEDKDATQTYIKTIEERLGGKLNRETLEVEKPQPEFKDGDIVFMKGIKSELFANCIFILRSEYKDGDERAFYYAFYNVDDKYTLDEYGNTKVHYSLRLATDSEKQQLFDALSKKGKRWDAEKKEVVNLKPKVELKPFDKVLVRDSKSDKWRANLLGYIDKDEYYHCVYANWVYCIPYIGNESLLGTTKDVEG